MKLREIARQIRYGEIVLKVTIQDGNILRIYAPIQEISQPYKIEGATGKFEIFKEIEIEPEEALATKG